MVAEVAAEVREDPLDLAPAREKVPPGHALHWGAPSGANVPAAQRVHGRGSHHLFHALSDGVTAAREHEPGGIKDMLHIQGAASHHNRCGFFRPLERA